ncbi:hypothetical protein SAMN02927900_00135 [Rhizobium mongolense subsp. loessense]|uniref:Uncharacterized protein n=1 Tax=Rhizobium mongolense subsp. loessense TaxID=158890 RepID=A0A1G4P833_9HYPH|nr:hypothetical protein SAMN02927900_00135 [Rhizobium mongolense subsp. loessense]
MRPEICAIPSCNACDNGRSLPAGLYTGEDVFEADFDDLAPRVDCDVPEPGDATVIDTGKPSQIVLRVHRHQNRLDDEHP